MAERRDRLGRRIGRNWWREYNCDLLGWAREAWDRQAEAATGGYATELDQYKVEHPMPTLKEFLISNKGTHRSLVV